ncbi:ABC transporter permease [Caenispirillum salinarum]|uniref:ABC transporter permease n=1 Tax=Caenispirillum salinarum TaxID=859058 RepID=UPI00384CF4D3
MPSDLALSQAARPQQPQADRAAERAERAQLKSRLRRAERMKQLKAFGLIAPLLLFLIITFVVPIADMMLRSVHDPDLSEVWPRTTAAIEQWEDRTQLPGEPVYAAIAQDMKDSRANRTIAQAARRLNYDINGARTLVMGTARRLPDTTDSWKSAMIDIDETWGEIETFGAIARASGPFTSFYLLNAVDLERTATGEIVKAPEKEAVYIDIFTRTFVISMTVTLICALLGFPVAYLLANLPPRIANVMMILVLLPFWTSLLVRTAAWVVLLQEQGLVNDALIFTGILDEPVRMIYNRIGVYIAMVHILLPFMILPLYSVMKGIKPVYMKAATSLGAPPTTAFLRVYLPQTIPGLSAGGLLVFIISIGYYITPALVGGAADQMISYFIAFYTSDTVNWGMASALGAVLLVATMILYGIYNRLIGADKMRLG